MKKTVAQKKECNLEGDGGKCIPGYETGYPCCFYCSRKNVCDSACCNHPDRCGHYAGTPKSDFERESRKICEDHKNGMSIKAIAKKYSISVGAVQYRLKKMRGK